MFDAEKAFNDWKKALRKIEAFEAGIVADLELQLRETFETLKSEGMPEEEAFRQAVAQLGNPEEVAAEYHKNQALALDRRRPWRPSRLVPALGWSYLKTAWRAARRNPADALRYE